MNNSYKKKNENNPWVEALLWMLLIVLILCVSSCVSVLRVCSCTNDKESQDEKYCTCQEYEICPDCGKIINTD